MLLRQPPAGVQVLEPIRHRIGGATSLSERFEGPDVEDGIFPREGEVQQYGRGGDADPFELKQSFDSLRLVLSLESCPRCTLDILFPIARNLGLAAPRLPRADPEELIPRVVAAPSGGLAGGTNPLVVFVLEASRQGANFLGWELELEPSHARPGYSPTSKALSFRLITCLVGMPLAALKLGEAACRWLPDARTRDNAERWPTSCSSAYTTPVAHR
jgi:hypothetical protein